MILALDYGEKRIGVAITDATGRYAVPLDFIPNKSELKKITKKEFPKGTSDIIINEARKAAKKESKVEFRKLCNKLLYLLNLHYPEKIVIGLPTTVDPKTNEPIAGKQAKKVKEFIKKFESCLRQNKIIMDIEFIEESMSSHIAEERLKTQGLTSGKIKTKVDSESARILLEGYLKN